MTKVLFPCLMEATTLTSVAFEGIGAIDDFQLVAASDAPAFTKAPYVVSFKGVGDSDWTADAITSTGTIADPGTPEVDGYKFIGWYAKEDCSGDKIEFPYTITANTTIYAKFEALPVAQIGEETYATLQEAITAAIDSTETAVEINIIRSFTTDATVTLTGKGTNDTQIVLNISDKDVTVTLAPHKDHPGFSINNAKVTFKGEGKWTRPSGTKTVFCIGETLVDDALAPGHVIIEGGSFYALQAHVFNVMNGVIEVNGGTFQTDLKTGYCVRAETSDLKDSSETVLTGASYVYINAGTFIKPENADAKPNDQAAPIGIKNDHKTTYGGSGTAHVEILEQKEGEDGDLALNTDITFKGNEWAIRHIMQQYLASDYALVKDSKGVYQIAERVAEIAESTTVSVGYGSLQNAIDAAIAADSSADAPAQIDILRDITLERIVEKNEKGEDEEKPQLTLLGKGMESTYIVLNNAENTVTFHTVGKGGLVIDNATVTFKGQGTWKNDNGSESNPKTMICVGEQGITDADNTLKLAPADVTVKEGTFTTAKGHLFNVAEGRITVEDGNFSVTTATGKSCFRAEDSELDAVDKEDASATLVIKGGTFEVPVDNNTIAPVGTVSSCKKARTYISVAGQPKFKCNDVCFTDNAKFLSMNSYFAEIGTDEEGDDTYTDSEDYKFVKGEDCYWASAKITWASVTITWDEGVTSFDLVDGDTETITTEGKNSEVSKYDVDEKVSVKIENIQFATDYELDSANSTLSITEVTADGKLHIAAKLKYSPVSPETTKTFETEDEAKAYAAAIIAHPTELITAPEGMETTYTSDYAKLFTATVSAAASGSSYEVVVVLSADAKETIQTQVDGVFAKFTNLSDLSSGDATLSIMDAIPGLYYTVYSSTDVTAVTTPSESKLATSKSVELTFPTQENSNCGFYRVGVSDVKIK